MSLQTEMQDDYQVTLINRPPMRSLRYSTSKRAKWLFGKRLDRRQACCMGVYSWRLNIKCLVKRFSRKSMSCKDIRFLHDIARLGNLVPYDMDREKDWMMQKLSTFLHNSEGTSDDKNSNRPIASLQTRI